MSCLGGSGNIFSCKIYVLSLENHNEPAIAKEDIFSSYSSNDSCVIASNKINKSVIML